jgi:hypothetical protein
MAVEKKTEKDETPPEAPVGPSKARKAFLAGELTWREYCAAEANTAGVKKA